MRTDQEFLEAFVRYHRWKYYLDQPEISDEEFDEVYDELEARYPESEVLAEVGATPGSPCPPRPEAI